jgi:Saxitoxin biosynthesis operon protein SxtJ
MKIAPHETDDLTGDEEAVGPSNRSFGLVFAAIFLAAGAWPLVRGADPRVWALGVAAAFLIAALLRPALLAPLNRTWLRLGLAMHRVVNPVVMAVLFYGVLTPFALVLRLGGKRFGAASRPDPNASTYWIDRRAERASRMDQQF